MIRDVPQRFIGSADRRKAKPNRTVKTGVLSKAETRQHKNVISRHMTPL